MAFNLYDTKIILYIYSLASLITFIIYAWDKLSAKKNWNRIPENALHLLSFFCGWPGAILAQKLFRHKTQKQPFRYIFFITMLLNIAALIGLLMIFKK